MAAAVGKKKTLRKIQLVGGRSFGARTRQNLPFVPGDAQGAAVARSCEARADSGWFSRVILATPPKGWPRALFLVCFFGVRCVLAGRAPLRARCAHGPAARVPSLSALKPAPPCSSRPRARPRRAFSSPSLVARTVHRATAGGTTDVCVLNSVPGHRRRCPATAVAQRRSRRCPSW